MRIQKILFFITSILILQPIDLTAQVGSISLPITYPTNNYYTCSMYVASMSPKTNTEISGTIKVTATLNASSNQDCNYPNRRACIYSLTGGFADKTYSNTTGTFDTNTMETGTYKATARCTYSSTLSPGERTATGTATYNLVRDTAAPVVTITNLTEGMEVYGEIAIKATASDATTGKSAITGVHFFAGNEDLGILTAEPYSTRFDTSKLPNGALRILVRATDSSGNAATAAVNLNVKNHESAPAVQILNLTDGQVVNGNVTVQVNASDDEGLRFVRYYVDGNLVSTVVEPPYHFPVNTSQFPNGVHQVGVVAEDFNGLLGAAAVDLTFENFDRKPPFVQFRTPLTGTVAQGQIPVDLYTDDETGIRSVQLYLNDTLYTEFTGNNFQAVLDTTKISNGLYYLTAIATDNANNVGFQTVLLIVRNGDSLEPSVGIMLPQESSVIKGLVTIVANAVDNVAVDGVEFYLDDVLLGESKVAPYQWKFDSAKYPDGAHKISAVAYDFTGFKAKHDIRVIINNGSVLDASILPTEARILPAFVYGDGGFEAESILENVLPEVAQKPGSGENNSFSMEDIKTVLGSVSQSIAALNISAKSKQKVSKQNPEHSMAIKNKVALVNKNLKNTVTTPEQSKKMGKIKAKFSKFQTQTNDLLKSKGESSVKLRNQAKKSVNNLIKSF